ncbi:olfactory receptor 2AP1-like [Discoglossus pictus]
MISHNQTQFILLGFSASLQIQICIFSLLLPVYFLSLLGNLAIIASICLCQYLHTPMYYFLGSLAFLDIWFISCTVPKVLITLLSGNKAISQIGCLMQFYIYVSVGGTEFYHLALMSLDRYLAICNPLRYSTLMTNPLCWKLIISSWIFGFLEFIPAVLLVSQLQWCSSVTTINHFFCDGSALLHMSCSYTNVVEAIIFGVASFAILSSLIPNISSYCCILSCIFAMSSSSGRRKTFSTCSSHLIVVLLAYGSCIFIYVRPAGSMSSGSEKVVAVFNSILSPFLNPFIYTLRNQIFKKLFRDLFRVSVKR